MSYPELDAAEQASLHFFCAYVGSSDDIVAEPEVIGCARLDVTGSNLLGIREIGDTPLHERENIFIEKTTQVKESRHTYHLRLKKFY